MLKFELTQTTNIQLTDLLQPKNLRFSSRTNLIQTRYPQAENQPHILALSVFPNT